jgi:hypothetical protein
MQKEKKYNKEKRKGRYRHQCGLGMGILGGLHLSFLTEYRYD